MIATDARWDEHTMISKANNAAHENSSDDPYG